MRLKIKNTLATDTVRCVHTSKRNHYGNSKRDAELHTCTKACTMNATTSAFVWRIASTAKIARKCKQHCHGKRLINRAKLNACMRVRATCCNVSFRLIATHRNTRSVRIASIHKQRMHSLRICSTKISQCVYVCSDVKMHWPVPKLAKLSLTWHFYVTQQTL